MLKINNTKFFLTYPQCALSKQKVLESLKTCFGVLNRKVQHYVVAEEQHEDGSPHLHAYIELDRAHRGTVDARFLDIEGHHPNIEYVRSNCAVIKYCTKEGDYITDMDLNKKVTKNDLAVQLMGGKSLIDVVKENPKFLFGYTRIKQDLQAWKLDIDPPTALDRTCGVWIGGPSGCGKSTIATTTMGPYYFKGPNKWWDGYNGQETVVCEDVDVSWKETFPYFKIWCDKYAFIGETKGGSINIRPKRIVVTSNKSLEELLELLSWPKDDYVPYVRRFNQHWITCPQDWEDQL